MRDVLRLNGFYHDLREIHKEYFPNWRFGQLMYNFRKWVVKKKKKDPFYIEEEEMLEMFRQYTSAATGKSVRIYFTFGSSEQYPFGREDYVVSEGLDREDAIRKFRKMYPDVHKGILNCADWYTEEDFKKHCAGYFSGKEPAVMIR